MSLLPGSLYDVYVKCRVDDLLREAEHDRLVRQVERSGHPLRVELAGWLRAAAQWIEGRPQLAGA